jgi:hypothetical protein
MLAMCRQAELSRRNVENVQNEKMWKYTGTIRIFNFNTLPNP